MSSKVFIDQGLWTPFTACIKHIPQWNDSMASRQVRRPTQSACLPTHRHIAVKLNKHSTIKLAGKINSIVVVKYGDIVA